VSFLHFPILNAMPVLILSVQGTWQFISVLLLKQPTKPHTIQDDIESFIYIILYQGLSHLKHNKTEQLGVIMDQVFDFNWKLGDTYTGGEGKNAMFRAGGYIDFDFEFTDNAPMTDWLQHAINSGGDWLTWVARKMPKALVAASSSTPSFPIAAPLPNNTGLAFETHDAFVEKWKELLDRSDWPPAGKDLEPRKVNRDTSSRPSATVSSAGSSGSAKRSRRNSLAKDGDDDEYTPSRKRAKAKSGPQGKRSQLNQSYGVDSD
jgi:hypothetical protein